MLSVPGVPACLSNCAFIVSITEGCAAAAGGAAGAGSGAAAVWGAARGSAASGLGPAAALAVSSAAAAGGVFFLNHAMTILPGCQPYSPIAMINATALDTTALEI
ncbi:WGS project CABT00000000 data, contig 2.27 [Pseudomonas sp. St29]|nr:WGS project CABT00000000 data, contig 2.27 [Pseudomonas sp. St29]